MTRLCFFCRFRRKPPRRRAVCGSGRKCGGPGVGVCRRGRMHRAGAEVRPATVPTDRRFYGKRMRMRRFCSPETEPETPHFVFRPRRGVGMKLRERIEQHFPQFELIVLPQWKKRTVRCHFGTCRIGGRALILSSEMNARSLPGRSGTHGAMSGPNRRSCRCGMPPGSGPWPLRTDSGRKAPAAAFGAARGCGFDVRPAANRTEPNRSDPIQSGRAAASGVRET